MIAAYHAHAGDPASQKQGEATSSSTGIAIEQLGTLVYPPLMTLNAIYSGEVSAVISVDAGGVLSDYLVTAYTHPEFANAVISALKRWRYQAATINGTPTASRANLLFDFRDRGVIVQTFPGAIIRRAFFTEIEGRFVYSACQLRELDRIPTPIHVISPTVSGDDAQHDVTVEFYIDEEGKVRMPAVSRERASDIFAAAAVQAVEQWRFEPPLRHGRPALVLAEQEFRFRPKRP